MTDPTHRAESVRIIADALWDDTRRWIAADNRPIPRKAAEIAVEAIQRAGYLIVPGFPQGADLIDGEIARAKTTSTVCGGCGYAYGEHATDCVLIDTTQSAESVALSEIVEVLEARTTYDANGFLAQGDWVLLHVFHEPGERVRYIIGRRQSDDGDAHG